MARQGKPGLSVVRQQLDSEEDGEKLGSAHKPKKNKKKKKNGNNKKQRQKKRDKPDVKRLGPGRSLMQQ